MAHFLLKVKERRKADEAERAAFTASNNNDSDEGPDALDAREEDDREWQIGLVTHVDEHFNYVWSGKLRAELRYPSGTAQEFKPGEEVEFAQTGDGSSAQISTNLRKRSTQPRHFEVLSGGAALSWKLKANVIFARRNSPLLEGMQKKQQIMNGSPVCVKGIAISRFGLVASFSDLNPEEGAIYEAYITRFPTHYADLSRQVETIWYICSTSMMKTNNAAIEELLGNCSFPEQFVAPTEARTGAEHLAAASNERGAAEVENEEEPLAEKCLVQPHSAVEDECFLGLTVRVTSDYSVIWGPKHGLVRVQHELERRRRCWQLSSWVNYRAFEDQSLLQGVTCKYTAYHVSMPTQLSHRIVVLFDDEIAICAELSRYEQGSTEQLHGIDNFLGRVNCPPDAELVQKAKDQQTSKVMALFSEHGTFSKWLAFAKEDSNGGWSKLHNLPEIVDAQVEKYFARFFKGRNGPLPWKEELQMSQMTGSKYERPKNWNGPVHVGDKIEDVVGIVFQHEEEGRVSVIATRFGIARQATHIGIGVWSRATIGADGEDGAAHSSRATHENRMRDMCSYTVLSSRKTMPVLPTRVVRPNGVDKLLLCGNVNHLNGNDWSNQYLGLVQDPHQFCKPSETSNRTSTGYLVEIGIGRSETDKRQCFWKVLKCHGKSMNGVHSVPLELSIFPDYMGDTCDNAHLILINNKFDANLNEQEQQVGPVRASVRPQVQLASAKNSPASAASSQHSSAPQNHHSVAMDNENYDDTESIAMSRAADNFSMQLQMYKPKDEAGKRVSVLVVRKRDDYALLYNKIHGMAILFPHYAKISLHEFDTKFKLGTFWRTALVPVEKESGPKYKSISIGDFREKEFNLPFRATADETLQVYLECEFSAENVKKCAKSPAHLFVADTQMGKVLISKEAFTVNEFSEKTLRLWVTCCIPRQFSCYWRVHLDDKGAVPEFEILNRDNKDVFPSSRYSTGITDEVETGDVVEAELLDIESDIPCSSAAAANHASGLYIMRGAYANFLFGKAVSDGLAGAADSISEDSWHSSSYSEFQSQLSERDYWPGEEDFHADISFTEPSPTAEVEQRKEEEEPARDLLEFDEEPERDLLEFDLINL